MKQPAKLRTDAPGGPACFSWQGAVVPAFFAALFLYTWLRLEPSAEYHHAAPVFRWNSTFLDPHLRYAGGLAHYGAALLAQLDWRDPLGALAFTLLGVSVFGCTRLAWPAPRPAQPRSWALLLLPLLLLVLRERYGWRAGVTGLGWLFAAGVAAAAGSGFRHWPAARIAAAWLGALLVFYVAGAGPCWFFVTLFGVAPLVLDRRWIGALAAAAAAPAVSWLLPRGGWLTATAPLQMSPMETLPWLAGPGLHLFVCLAMAGAAGARRFFQRTQPAPSPRQRAASRARRWPGFPSERLAETGLLALLACGWLGVWLAFDAPRHARARLDRATQLSQFERVLEAARALPAVDPASEIRLHRALFHAGRLGSDLFTFTNQTGWDLMPALKQGLLDPCRPQCETLLELGQAGFAEHYAHEALEWEGERPDLLLTLARINILKERPRAARVFLGALAEMPFHRARAREQLDRLAADPRLEDDPILRRIRPRMVSLDLPHDALPTESMLLHLLDANRTNQMAFEYLMAHYLLSRRVDRLGAEIRRLNDFGYREIPRHWEEALLILELNKGQAQPDLQGRGIRAETRARFQEFSAAITRGDFESEAGRLELRRRFGDTYWHYYLEGMRETRPPAASGSMQ